MPDFYEGERVAWLHNTLIVGKVDIVREFTDPDTDRPTGAPIYTVTWDDGEYSEHQAEELVALEEGPK